MLNLTEMFSARPSPVVGARFVAGRAQSLSAKAEDAEEVVSVLQADRRAKSEQTVLAALPGSVGHVHRKTKMAPSYVRDVLGVLEYRGVVRKVKAKIGWEWVHEHH